MSIARFLAPCLGAAILSTAPAAAAQDRPPTAQLGDFFGIRTVEVAIGGRDHTFLLDTGGGVTTISPALAEAVGCTPWSQINGFRMGGERLSMPRCDDVPIEIAGQALTVPSAGVFDLSPLLPPASQKFEGLVALDVLAARPFTLELASGRLTFETPESLARRTASAVQIPIRFHRQGGGIALTVMARATTGQGALWLQLDSGSDAGIQVATASAEPLGLNREPGGQDVTLSLTGTGGETIIETARGRVRDMIIDGNVGAPVLSRWVMTFDLANQKLWVQDAS